MSEVRKANINGASIEIERGVAGLYYGTSPDERGLLVAGASQDEVIAKVPEALDELRIVKTARA